MHCDWGTGAGCYTLEALIGAQRNEEHDERACAWLCGPILMLGRGLGSTSRTTSRTRTIDEDWNIDSCEVPGGECTMVDFE